MVEPSTNLSIPLANLGLEEFEKIEYDPLVNFPKESILIDTVSGDIQAVCEWSFRFIVVDTIKTRVVLRNRLKEKHVHIQVVEKDPTPKNYSIWIGPDIQFTKEDETDPTLRENQDRITELVWLTRSNDGGEL